MPQNKIITTQPNITPKNTNVIPITNMNIAPSKVLEPESMPQDDSQSRFLASLLSQGAGMFGAALQGENVLKAGQVFESNRDYQNKLNEQKKQIESLTNPESDVSKRKRLVYERALGIKIPGEFSASDLEDRNVLQVLVAQSQPKPVPGRVGGGVQKKESLAKNPFYKEIILTSNMGNSVDSDLKELSDLIKKSGNTPLIGPDKLRQQQLVNQIAINYNKILDPSSVVREAESGAVIKNLGLEWLTRSDVAKEAIDQFRNSVDRTVNNNIKGYYGMYSTFSPEEEQIAEDFKNNPNDPKISEAYSNLLSLKRKGVKL